MTTAIDNLPDLFPAHGDRIYKFVNEVEKTGEGLKKLSLPIKPIELLMKLVNRMRFYKIPDVSVGVINNGKIELARGYGVQEIGGNKIYNSRNALQD